jgi:Spy/CpxP family protein refolding chaperone
MKTRWMIGLSILALAGVLQSQNPPADAPGPPPGPRGAHAHAMMGRRHEMGKWWQNPEIASKLQLTDAQVKQLNQVFYDHKLKLIDYGAEMEKQDLKLQTLLDADQPDEAQVSSQVDQVLAARGQLEREYTMMNLNLRKVLSLPQWKQLKALRGDAMGPGQNFIHFQQKMRMGGPGDGPDAPPPPPPPGGLD